MNVDPELAAIYETPLEPAEFERRLRDALASLEGAEGEDLGELIDWFRRRYPTARDRLAYCRKKAAQMARAGAFAAVVR